MTLAEPYAPGATPHFVDQLQTVLGRDFVDVDLRRRREASTDYAWMSPILQRRLPATVADVVVSPADTDAVVRAVGLAHRHGVPVQPRGKGTGNYGQSVPFQGGMVIDTERFGAIVDLGPGWIEVESGATFVRMEAAARSTGQELMMFPTTVRSTVAGFLAGGAGGIGSVEHGFLWDPGFVQELEIVPCWDRPEPIVLSGSETAGFLHAYGTTGVISGARLALVPAHRWTALFAAFASPVDAMAAARAIATLEPKPRAVSVTDPGLVATFPADEVVFPLGTTSLRTIIDESAVAAATRVVAEAGGKVTTVRADGVSLAVSLAFNHVTLRAKQARGELCHLQVGGEALVDRREEVLDVLPESMLHHDLFAGGIGGLLLSRFVDEPTLRTGIDRLAALGVHVVDPHTWLLGAHGGLDKLFTAAARFDPDGLLNPGKLPRTALAA